MEGAPSLDLSLVDFVAAVSSQAICGAERVVAFFRELGVLPSEANPNDSRIALPAELLLGVDHALRFATWEKSGIFVHVEAGLPRAEELLEQVLELQHGPELQRLVTDIAAKSIKLLSSRFVWIAGVESQADLAMIVGDQEELIDAVADFLWSNRHDLSSGGNDA